MLILALLLAAAVLAIGALCALACGPVSDALCHRRSQLLARQPRGSVRMAARP